MLLVAASWRTNLTLRQRAPLFGVSKSAADRIIGHLGPAHTLQQRKRFRKDAVLIADGNLVHPRPHHRRAVQELPVLHQSPGRHRRRRLPGYRPGHSAPQRERPERTPGPEGGAQRLAPQSPCPRGTPLRPDERLEDPSQLPTEGRRRPPLHARHRPPAQPRPCRVTQKPAGPHLVDAVPRHRRLLESHPAELAVRTPGRRIDGHPLGVLAPKRLPRIQASRRGSYLDRRRGVDVQPTDRRSPRPPRAASQLAG